MTAQAGLRGAVGTPRSIWKSIGLAVITLGIYTFFWTYKTHNELNLYSGAGVGGVVGLVIYVLISIVTYFVLPSEVRKLYELDGRESPVRGTTGFWIFLPIIGAFVWFFKVQGALNDFWVSKGAPAPN